MNFEVQILGSNSALAAHGRHPTAQLIKHRHNQFLIDCGEGTQTQLQKFKAKPFKIDYIFISHLHGDHYFGLIGLITTYHLLQRKTPLTIIGPKALEPIIKMQLEVANTQLCYELFFRATQTETIELVYEDPQLTIHTFPLLHRIPCTGFLFKEKKHLKKIQSDKVKSLSLNTKLYEALRAGQDIYDLDGQFHLNDQLTIPGQASRSYAYCSDTIFHPPIIQIIQGVDLLYHETTFMNDCKERAYSTFHSTTGQAAEIARSSQVKRMLIGHFSSKYTDLLPLLEEAKAVFSNTELAIEGTSFMIGKE